MLPYFFLPFVCFQRTIRKFTEILGRCFMSSCCKDDHFRVHCFIPVCATRSFLKELHLYHEFETDCPNLVFCSILFVLCTQFVKLEPYGVSYLCKIPTFRNHDGF